MKSRFQPGNHNSIHKYLLLSNFTRDGGVFHQNCHKSYENTFISCCFFSPVMHRHSLSHSQPFILLSCAFLMSCSYLHSLMLLHSYSKLSAFIIHLYRSSCSQFRLFYFLSLFPFSQINLLAINICECTKLHRVHTTKNVHRCNMKTTQNARHNLALH